MLIDRIGGLSGSIAIKVPCRVATTANIVLSGLLTIDGVALAADDRVLVKNQTNGSENGIYIAATGTWTRSPDFDGSRDVAKGTLVGVTNGTVGGGYLYQVTTANPITVGTTAISFAIYYITSAIAANIANTPAGTIAATNVQAALNELDAEKALLAGSASQNFAMNAGTVAGTFTVEGAQTISSLTPQLKLTETAATADNKTWRQFASAEALYFSAINDAATVENAYLTINRTGAAIDSVAIGGTAATIAGTLAVTGAISPAAGVAFPATQNAIANVNTLDDYEEGTWTPTIAFGGAAVGATYSSQNARYTKIGNKVTVSGFLALTAKGSSTGSAAIAGLPFTVASFGAGSLVPNVITYTGMMSLLLDSGTTLKFYHTTEAGVLSALTDANFANTSSVYFSATYLV